MNQDIRTLSDLENEISAIIETGRKNAFDAVIKEMEGIFSEISMLLQENDGISLLARRPINGLSYTTLRNLATANDRRIPLAQTDKETQLTCFIEFMKVRSLTFEATRLKYPNYLKPWTKEEDEELERLWCEGLPVKSIAILFKRNPGAIRSRIDKLELEMKYGGR